MKVKIATLIILLFTHVLAYLLGSNEMYMAADVHKDGTESIMYPHFYNKAKALRLEREYSFALLEGLHRFYSNDDNDAWFDLFVPTKEYQRIDSLNGGDWEYFYDYETTPLSY